MRILVMSMAIALSVFGIAEAPRPGHPSYKRTKPTPEEQAARNLKRQQLTGGLIEKPGTKCGRVVWVNAQKRVAGDLIALTLKEQTKVFLMDFDLVVGDAPTVLTAAAAKDALKANVAIFVIDDPAMPSMLVAPEGNWGIMNVAPLMVGGPTTEVVSKRVAREMWRTFGNVLGGGDCSYHNCVSIPISSVEELDRMKANTFCPDPFARVRNHLSAAGVKAPQRATYKRACMEGWAPAPTNEFQRVIWEQIKQDKERGPTNPIKISPPNKQ